MAGGGGGEVDGGEAGRAAAVSGEAEEARAVGAEEGAAVGEGGEGGDPVVLQAGVGGGEVAADGLVFEE